MPHAVQVQLTRQYVAALAAAWVLVLAALPLRSPSLALAGILLGTVVALGAQLPRRPRIRATVALSKPTPVEEELVDVSVSLRNGGSRAVFGEWRISLPGASSIESGESAGYRFLGRGAEETTQLGLRFHMFGRQLVGPVQLRLEDPFGFTMLELTFGDAMPLRVYPRRDPLRDSALRAKQKRTLRGAYEVSQPGTGFEFFGLRGYVPGDRPRDVNWKASARVGTIIVNQHQKETDAEIVLLVDIRATTQVGRRTRSPFAQSCRAALAIAEAHLRARDAVRLIAYGDRLHEDRHTGATRRLQGVLDLVADLQPEGALPLGDVVRQILPTLRPRSPIMLFSPLVGDASAADALSLLVTRRHPIGVLVPRPDWTSGVREEQRLAWDAQQALALARLRRAGIPSALHPPRALLQSSLAHLQVVSA